MLDEYLDTFPGSIVQFVIEEMLKFDMAATSWQALTDKQREERKDKMCIRAASLAKALVESVMAGDAVTVSAEIGSVTFKKNVQVVLTASRGAKNVSEFANQPHGSAVLITLAQDMLELDAPSPQQAELET